MVRSFCPDSTGLFRAFITVTLCAFLLVPQTALAQDAGSRNFKQVVAEAKAARQSGELERSAKLLLEAYEIKPLPVLLNNLGKVYEELGWYSDAVKVYQRVADDPQAPNELRSLDTARIGALTPRLSSAWVMGPEESNWKRLVVDGEMIAVRGSEEVLVPVGTHLVMVQTTADSMIYLNRAFVRGRRITLSAESLPSTRKLLTLDIGGLSPLPRAIYLDEEKVDANLGRIRRLHLEPGRHQIRVESRDGLSHEVVFEGQAGETRSLLPLLPSWPPMDSTISSHDDDIDATVHTEASSSSGIGSLITMGAGLVLVGTGAYFLYQASDIRDGLSDDTSQLPVPHTEITQKRAFELRDEANSKALWGSVLTIGGGAALGVGALWFVFLSGGSQAPGSSTGVSLSLLPSLSGVNLEINY